MKDSKLLVNIYTDLGSPKFAKLSPTASSGSEPEALQEQKQEQQANQQVQQDTEVKPICPVPVGQRVYCDAGISLEGGQSWLGEAFALVTMCLYLGWIHILLMLMVGALFSKTCLWICIGR